MNFLGSRVVLFFVAVWRLVADAGMKPIGIVPALNELEDREARLRFGGERVPLDPLRHGHMGLFELVFHRSNAD